jgi:LAO/AO transport system kinase
MEMADILLVNKADGALLTTANLTLADYAGALRLLRHRPQDPEGFPAAMTVSALENRGIKEAWAAIQSLAAWRRAEGHWANTRADQARHWFAQEVRQGLLAALDREPVLGLMQLLGEKVALGQQTPDSAAADLLARLGR